MIKFNVKKKEECFNKTIRLPESIINKIENIATKNNVSFNKIVLDMINFEMQLIIKCSFIELLFCKSLKLLKKSVFIKKIYNNY